LGKKTHCKADSSPSFSAFSTASAVKNEIDGIVALDRETTNGAMTMKIAVLSDIHDNIWQLEALLKTLEPVAAAVFCGDFCAPFTLKQLAEGISGTLHVVFGNNDGDQLLLSRIADQAGNVQLHGPFAELELDGRHIFAIHYPQVARAVAASGHYDLVLYGHDHIACVKQFGRTVLANPGEVMGRFGRSTYGLYDTLSGGFEIQEVPRK